MKCPKCGDDRAQQLLVSILCPNHHCENFDETLAKEKVEKLIYAYKDTAKYSISASPFSSVISTTSSVETDIFSLSIPQAGTYQVSFFGEVKTVPANPVRVSMNLDGKKLLEHVVVPSKIINIGMSTMLQIKTNQKLNIAWSMFNGTALMYDRKLDAMKVN